MTEGEKPTSKWTSDQKAERSAKGTGNGKVILTIMNFCNYLNLWITEQNLSAMDWEVNVLMSSLLKRHHKFLKQRTQAIPLLLCED